MNTIDGQGRPVKKEGRFLACLVALVVVLWGGLVPAARAAVPILPGGTNFFSYTPLASFSFQDTNAWTSDQGYSPISFSNLDSSFLGNGSSLVVESTNLAWLNYYIYEPTNGATNLVVNGRGSLTFWYGPDWSSTNTGGNGPGDWAELIDIGELTTNAAYGYWGLSVDPAGENLWFISQDALGDTYSLSAPISWTTNYFHYIALTYSSTNVSLYLDGVLATNDPGGLSVWPSSTVISNGFFIGSDTNGIATANGLFDDIYTYNVPVDAGMIEFWFNEEFSWYMLNPNNIRYMDNLSSAGSGPSSANSYTNAITGAGYLQWTNAAVSITNTNPFVVWITNVTARAIGGGTMDVTFTIEGGQAGYLYDVFAIGALTSPISNGQWYWMGQGPTCSTYTLPISGNGAAFLILGTPQDSDGADLTDAYQLLVSKTNPNVTDSDLDGIPTGWEVLLGLNPNNSNLTDATKRANYGYTGADWLNGVTGTKSGSITNDPEGNVLQVSQ